MTDTAALIEELHRGIDPNDIPAAERLMDQAAEALSRLSAPPPGDQPEIEVMCGSRLVSYVRKVDADAAKLAAFDEGFQLAHEPARCGHARANYKDPNWGTDKYQSNEQCEFCAALAVPPLEDRIGAATKMLIERIPLILDFGAQGVTFRIMPGVEDLARDVLALAAPTPPPEEIAGLIEKAERAILLRITPPIHEMIAALRSQAAEIERLKDELQTKRPTGI